MLKQFFVILSLLFLVSTFAQKKNKGVQTLNDIPDEFYNEMTVGITTNTNSALIGGFTFKYLRQINDKWYHAFGAEIVNVKNPKEQKFASYQTGNNFILGKLNHLYSLRLQYGRELMLFGKYPEDGVRVSANIMGGLTLGFVKPYYIEYDYSTSSGPDYRIEPYNPDIHENVTRILGRGGFFHGFDKISVKPGINLKAALNFEFGTGELLQSVTGLEIGFNFEVFAQEIPIFEVGNKGTFTSLFCILYIGSRY